jgi:hypothetical protein
MSRRMFPYVEEVQTLQQAEAESAVGDPDAPENEEGAIIIRRRRRLPSLYFVTRTESLPHETPAGVTSESLRELRERIRLRHPGTRLTQRRQT